MDSSSELIAVSTLRLTADAQIAKGVLDEEGIESMIRSDNAGENVSGAGNSRFTGQVRGHLRGRLKRGPGANANQPDNCPTSS